MKKWKMQLQNQNQNHTPHVTSSSTFNYQTCLTTGNTRIFSTVAGISLVAFRPLKREHVLKSWRQIGLSVYVIDARLKLSWPDADHVVITVLLLYLCSVFVKREGGTDFHHAENDLIHKYQINPTFLRVTKLLSSPLTDVRTYVGVIFIFYKSSFTSSLFNVPAVEGFPAVRMRDDILQRSGGRKEIKNKNGDERFLWDEVTSSAQTSLAWFHMRSADWTFWQPPLLRQRRNRFLRSVISDFRCGCGTMSSFPAQLLISYPEMSACRRWRMKTNHSPCKNWLNDRL